MVAHFNQNKQIDGIVCDICGAICTQKFTYYSAKFDRVLVNGGSGSSSDVEVDKRFMDLDYCERCFESTKSTVLKVIKERDKAGKWSASSSTGHKK